MHVLFVTSEVAGIFKLGGLADVSRSLPNALAREGVDVTVTLPFYSSIDVTSVRGVGKLAVDFAGKREIVFVFSKHFDSPRETLLLFRHPRLNEYKKHPIEETFAFYSKVISTFYAYGTHLVKKPFNIVHCHDWHTALVPVLIGEQNRLNQKQSLQSTQVRSLMTIHNLLYQGVTDSRIIRDIGVPRSQFHILGQGRAVRISFLREGLSHADRISTVSPTYAGEIVAHARRDAIGDVLVKRRADMTGIINGIDTSVWNPRHDHFIKRPYDSSSVITGKKACTDALRAEVGLPDENVPVFGFVGRIEPRQKGIELIMASLEKLLPEHEFQTVILGTGDRKTADRLTAFARKHHRQVTFVNAFDEGLAHRIYAGSTMFLVPSKFEPCGLTQMIAMRYGTVPVVRKTGGLADTVHDGETGIVFDGYNEKSLSAGILRALTVWRSPPAWRSMQMKCMHEDFSWTGSAKRYIELYKKLFTPACT